MKKILATFMFCTLSLTVISQTQQQDKKLDTIVENGKYWSAWLQDLYDVGVVMEKDSIKINDEARKIIIDSNYRKLIYPPAYTWQAAVILLKQMELKKGFWYLFNLYIIDTLNRKLVIESIVSFEKIMDLEKIMTSTFYTYAMLDPQICNYNNGKLIITRPDIVEKKFNTLKEIINYISIYKKGKKDG